MPFHCPIELTCLVSVTAVTRPECLSHLRLLKRPVLFVIFFSSMMRFHEITDVGFIVSKVS